MHMYANICVCTCIYVPAIVELIYATDRLQIRVKLWHIQERIIINLGKHTVPLSAVSGKHSVQLSAVSGKE